MRPKQMEVHRQQVDLVENAMASPRFAVAKANPNWQQIPVIAVTAMAMTGDRDRRLAAVLYLFRQTFKPEFAKGNGARFY